MSIVDRVRTGAFISTIGVRSGALAGGLEDRPTVSHRTLLLDVGAANGVSEVEVRRHSTGFSVEYDGRFVDVFDERAISAYGNAVPNPNSTMMAPNIQMLATAHGWRGEIADEDGSGTSIVIGNAQTNRSETRR